jgi:eukaryotic-like serine/threonine-protein kinase
MSKFPITQAQYQAIMGTNPAHFKGGQDAPQRPVEQVSWHEAVEFCDRLNRFCAEARRSQNSVKSYRLPSEAEWEYACRAGATTPFYFGNTLSTDQANYDGNYTYGDGKKGIYRQTTTPVGSFPANAFGLQDMHGNVWEWCQDPWHENYGRAPQDGSVWQEGGDQSKRLLRGGSWNYDPGICRSADRGGYSPVGRSYGFGFRVVGCC